MKQIDNKINFLKNPIGIIGIFLVLTEGIAGLVVGKNSLKDIQNTILILFVLIFPLIVLYVFFILVTKHHEKLYSLSDYKDEQNFVNTYKKGTLTDKDPRNNKRIKKS